MMDTPNTELLERVMTKIRDDPESWNQASWLCGTSACFAGHAVLESGYVRASVLDPDARSWAFISDTVKDSDGVFTHVRLAAIKQLNITDFDAHILFDASNNLDDLEMMVKDLTNGEKLSERWFVKVTGGEKYSAKWVREGKMP